MAVTPKQTELFNELIERKQFPEGADLAQLKKDFDKLSRATASQWIDRALKLPNAAAEDDKGSNTPAPF